MKRTYRKPAMVTYTQDDIVELMGPVKTQYVPEPPPPPPCVSCALDIAPEEFIQVKPNQTMELTVDTQGCPAFQEVRVEIPGEPEAVFTRADGVLNGNDWIVAISDLQFLVPPGDYSVIVTLIDGAGNQSSTCEASFTIVL